jgi:hypothetical protein
MKIREKVLFCLNTSHFNNQVYFRKETLYTKVVDTYQIHFP